MVHVGHKCLMVKILAFMNNLDVFAHLMQKEAKSTRFFIFWGEVEHFVTFILTFTSSTLPGSKEIILYCVWSPFESEYFSTSFM